MCTIDYFNFQTMKKQRFSFYKYATSHKIAKNVLKHEYLNILKRCLKIWMETKAYIGMK